MKLKDWLVVAAIILVCFLVLTHHGQSYPGHNADEYYEKQQEARIEEELYRQELWKEGYDAWYDQAKWEDRGELERLEHEVDHAYEAGLEDGYESCLEEHGLSND